MSQVGPAEKRGGGLIRFAPTTTPPLPRGLDVLEGIRKKYLVCVSPVSVCISIISVCSIHKCHDFCTHPRCFGMRRYVSKIRSQGKSNKRNLGVHIP